MCTYAKRTFHTPYINSSILRPPIQHTSNTILAFSVTGCYFFNPPAVYIKPNDFQQRQEDKECPSEDFYPPSPSFPLFSPSFSPATTTTSAQHNRNHHHHQKRTWAASSSPSRSPPTRRWSCRIHQHLTPRADMRGTPQGPTGGVFRRNRRRISGKSLPLTPRARERAAWEVLDSIPVLEVTTPNGAKRPSNFEGPSRAAGPNASIGRGKSSRTEGAGLSRRSSSLGYIFVALSRRGLRRRRQRWRSDLSLADPPGFDASRLSSHIRSPPSAPLIMGAGPYPGIQGRRSAPAARR